MANVEKKVAKMFITGNDGCLNALFGLKPATYYENCCAEIKTLGLDERSKKKLDIDESQVAEVTPLKFWGFGDNYDDDIYPWVFYHNNLTLTPDLSATYIYCAEDRIYYYTYSKNEADGSVREVCEEFPYSKIGSVSTDEVSKKAGKKSQPTKILLLKISVMGEKYFSAVNGSPDAEASIRAIKQKIREKTE